MEQIDADRPLRDWLMILGSDCEPDARSRNTDDERPAFELGLHPISARDLLAREVTPAEMIIDPWLPTQGLAMIHAPRGIGKTHVSVGLACAVAMGCSFLRWTAPKPRSVLLIDGEMPAAQLQERLANTSLALGVEMSSARLDIVAADLERDGLPDLATEAGQAFFADVLRPADFVIIDNLSTICRSLRENEADSWGPIQSWALRMRREGKTVLFVHHGNKSGGQRGTSRKEDILNTVIALRRPPDYEPRQGARFEVHYEKARGFFGEEAEPFEAWLKEGQWVVDDIKRDDDAETMHALRAQGMSIRGIAERTGVPKSSVDRRLKERDP